MSDLRESLETAYDAIDTGTPAEPVASPEPAPVTSAPAASEPARTSPVEGRTREPDGKFAPEPKKPAAKPAPEGVKVTTAPIGTKPVEQAPVEVKPVVPAAPTLKAPQSWKPGAREEWAKIPPNAQAEIVRLERETKIAMQRAAEATKGNAALQELARPYEATIRAAGMDAPKYVQNLLQTAHSLSISHPQGKAAIIADLCAQFQVAPADLDQALVARINGQVSPQPSPQQQFRDPRFDQFLSQLEQAKAAKNQEAIAEAGKTAEEFASSHEFLDDVKDEVADILEVWAKRGKRDVTPDDLERAYTIACQNNPDVADIFKARRDAEAAQKAIASTATSRKAAVSVRSEPSAALGSSPAGRREALEAAWDKMSG